MRQTITTLVLTTMIVFTVIADNSKSPIDLGKENMMNKNYALAVEHFVDALGQLPQNERGQQYVYISEQLAIANLKLKNYTKSAFYFDQIITSELRSSKALFEYAKLLVTLQQYDKASQAFTEWGELTQNQQRADEYTTFLASLKTSSAADFDIQKTPWSTAQYNEYGPMLHPYGGIVYTSDRPSSNNNKNNLTNNYPSNLYMTGVHEGESQCKPDALFSNHFGYNRGVGCFSADGKTIYFTANAESNIPAFSSKQPQFTLGLFKSHNDGYKWSKPERLNISSTKSNYAFPSLSARGDTIIFSSDELGGHGGMDLYYSVLSNGVWSKPVNLGKEINTAGDEVYPNLIYQNGQRLLSFASNGRPGYGGLDVYNALDAFSDSVTIAILPQPINSSFDDFGYVTTTQKTIGYIASNRAGNDDIYAFSETNKKRIQPQPIDKPIKTIVTKTDTIVITDNKPTVARDTVVTTKRTVVKTPVVKEPVKPKVEKTTPAKSHIPEIESTETTSNTSEIVDANTLYGYYMVVYSVKNYDGFIQFRDANYPDAILVRNRNGFYHLAYYLSDSKDEAKSLFANREARFSKSWLTHFGD